ncbi:MULTISPECIES: helix-turn-helix transcriptional regulator [unclassified Verrucomicrobium]|uniref:helix-turn-helix domain-containing protein n=1 Tax=unclassified Verrucomicrobium TaxID=2625155 RepID=UPI0009DF9678|nr:MULTISPECIES: helix-turn-helix transcriptional regulator [unclassified Verrucomicrobium]
MGVQSLSVRFGWVLRSCRQELGLSQEELAEMAGLHATYIGLVERGKRNPSIDAASQLASALNRPLSALIASAESTKRDHSTTTRKKGGNR